MTTNLETAAAAWGADLPEWVRVLAESCDEIDQRQTAYRIGYSPPVVNAVLKNTYGAGSKGVRTAVEGTLMAITVVCPGTGGSMAVNICAKNQKRPFAATNPERVKLYRACRGGCPHSRIGRTTEAEGDGP